MDENSRWTTGRRCRWRRRFLGRPARSRAPSRTSTTMPAIRLIPCERRPKGGRRVQSPLPLPGASRQGDRRVVGEIGPLYAAGGKGSKALRPGVKEAPSMALDSMDDVLDFGIPQGSPGRREREARGFAYMPTASPDFVIILISAIPSFISLRHLLRSSFISHQRSANLGYGKPKTRSNCVAVPSPKER